MVLIAIPPAARVLAIAAVVYPTIQLAKKVPAFTKFLVGWKAIALNVVLTSCGLLIAIPANQLYTLNTAILLLTTILGSAGIHGTVSALSQPQVLATIPPSTQVIEVPAVLKPVDSRAVVVTPPLTLP